VTVRSRARAAVTLLAACLLAACGYVGEPLPPALNIASPVTDLRVVELGDRLVVDFTIPPLTTEGLVLTRLGSVELRIGPGTSPFDPDRWSESAAQWPVAADKTGPVHTDVPVARWVGQEVVIGVRVINPKGRPSGWSNLVSMRIAAPVPTPSDVAARSDPRGARITWSSPEHSFRIFRKGPGDKEAVQAGTSDKPEYVDATAQYGTTYEYSVQALAGAAESEMTGPVAVTPRDVFPPAVPSGLSAIAGIGAIELTWDRNTEPDLKGYRVYRTPAASGKFEPVADFVDTPAYSDRQVETGKQYRYAVSAIDLAGNESPMSTAVEITAP
jgi:hypothetical protein